MSRATAVQPRTHPALPPRRRCASRPHRVTRASAQGAVRRRPGGRLYCFSEERAAKERGIVERFAKRFEDALTKLSHGLSKPRTHKRLDKVWQRIGRLKAQSRGVAQHYDVELDTDKTGQRATAVRFTRRPVAGTMMTHPGVYCLRSNQTDWDEATLWRTYFTLTDVVGHIIS